MPAMQKTVAEWRSVADAIAPQTEGGTERTIDPYSLEGKIREYTYGQPDDDVLEVYLSDAELTIIERVAG